MLASVIMRTARELPCPERGRKRYGNAADIFPKYWELLILDPRGGCAGCAVDRVLDLQDVFLVQEHSGRAHFCRRSDVPAGGFDTFLMGVEKAKFRKPVRPGDQLFLETKLLSLRRNTAKIQGVVRVDGKVVTEAEIMFMLVPKDKR